VSKFIVRSYIPDYYKAIAVFRENHPEYVKAFRDSKIGYLLNNKVGNHSFIGFSETSWFYDAFINHEDALLKIIRMWLDIRKSSSSMNAADNLLHNILKRLGDDHLQVSARMFGVGEEFDAVIRRANSASVPAYISGLDFTPRAIEDMLDFLDDVNGRLLFLNKQLINVVCERVCDDKQDDVLKWCALSGLGDAIDVSILERMVNSSVDPAEVYRASKELKINSSDAFIMVEAGVDLDVARSLT